MGGSSMMKRFNLQTMVFIPYAGTTVQFGHIPHLISCRRGAALKQSLPQQISEELVIAVPAPLVVQGDEEQVDVFEIFQGCLPGTGGDEQNGITKRARHSVQDRCTQ